MSATAILLAGAGPRGISKSFGEVVALDGVDLDIAPGQVHGLVGPNGAGKTTLLGLLEEAVDFLWSITVGGVPSQLGVVPCGGAE